MNTVMTNGTGSAGALSGPETDGFDLAKLRLPQDYAGAMGVKKALLHVPVRKPDRHWFIRVHPDLKYRFDVAVIELRDENESYIVLPDVCQYVPEEYAPKTLFTAITRQGSVFLWPIRLPGEDGRLDEWNRTAREAARLATTTWVRIASRRAVGAYEVFEATATLPEPEWPTESFSDLLRIAFKNRVIDSLDHPVLQRLRGEA